MEQIHLKIQKALGPRAGLIEQVPFFVLLLTFFLLPFFFIPSQSAPFLLTKSTILYGGILIAFIIWVLLRLADGKLSLPRNYAFLCFALVPLSTFLAFVFSPVKGVSFLGTGASVDSLMSIFVLSSLLFLIPSSFKTKSAIFTGYAAVLLSFLVLGLFYLVRTISIMNGGDAFSFGVFGSLTENPLGKWNDVGIFAGAVLMLSMLTFYFLKPPALSRLILTAASIFALLIVSLVNLSVLWYLLGIFSLVFFVYTIILKRKTTTSSEGQSADVATSSKGASWLALVILLVSVLFIVDSFRSLDSSGRTPLAGSLAQKFSISQLEVRPSWSSTLSVAGDSLKENMIFGAGPSRFVNEWLKFKPAEVNSNLFFWDIDYAYGISLFATIFVTTGLVGGISWILMFLAFLYLGFKYAVRPHDDKVLRYLSASSFFTALFLWLFTLVYVPGIVVFAMTFLFTGIFLSTIFRHEEFKTYQMNIFGQSSAAFVVVVVLVLLLISGVTGEYITLRGYFAGRNYQKALGADVDVTQAENLLTKASSMSNFDGYERAAASLGVVKMRNVLTSKGATPEVLQGEFREILSWTIDHARRATEIDPTNYQNWVSLGSIYNELVPAIEGAYREADAAYAEALKVNPHHPGLYLLRARLEYTSQNVGKAKEYIDLALKEKENYAPAIFLRSQIESGEGKIKEAIASAEKASLIAPNDVGVFFQIGLLKYTNKDWKGAGAALERVVALNPSYANARYFLGLTYYRLNMNKEAVAQFEEILKTNSDNAEVKLILSNLKAGRSPFADARPPVDDQPEKRAKLPVEEKVPAKDTSSAEQ